MSEFDGMTRGGDGSHWETCYLAHWDCAITAQTNRAEGYKAAFLTAEGQRLSAESELAAAVAREAALLQFVDDIKDVTDIAIDDELSERIVGLLATPSPAAAELLRKAQAHDAMTDVLAKQILLAESYKEEGKRAAAVVEAAQDWLDGGSRDALVDALAAYDEVAKP